MGRAVSAAPTPVAVLLVELARRGIELRAAGDRLRYRPRSAMTPDLAARLEAHRADVLAILAVVDATADPGHAGGAAAPGATYTAEERRLLTGCPPRALELVAAAKAAFARSGGITVANVIESRRVSPHGDAGTCPGSHAVAQSSIDNHRNQTGQTVAKGG